MNPSMQGKALSCLYVSGFSLLLWLAYYPTRVTDDRQGIGVDCLDVVLPIQLTPKNLPYSLLVFGGCNFLVAS